MQASTRIGDRSVVHWVTGRGPVLGLGQRLLEFGARSDQAGAMQDLSYFLAKPGALPRVPHLLLVGTADLDPARPSLDHLMGVLLIFEQVVSGIRTGAFATNDRSGRSTLIAMPADRSRVAALAIRELLDHGAHLILMSFRAAGHTSSPATVDPVLLDRPGGSDRLSAGRGVARWAQRDRIIPGYLPLANSFDATLATIGQRTRSNLRYYRRRAERDLGCVFVPRMEVSREEMLDFSGTCMYPVSAEVAGWRYDSLQELREPIFMGIRDREGRWLSMLGGRRYQGRSELLWQFNRDGYAPYSLGTVMRSYLIEHEIAQGSCRLYIEGGTPHPIKFSFVPENVTDLVVVRRTLAAKAMRMVARRYISHDNELSHMLSARDLEWMPC